MILLQVLGRLQKKEKEHFFFVFKVLSMQS